MNQFRTISAIMLALLVLVSSTSFTIGVHICMGEVQNIALFSKAEGCAMEKKLPPCHKHLKQSCCQDETILHQASELKASVCHFNFSAPVTWITVAPSLLLSEIVPIENYNIAKGDYDPPLPSIDRIIELQVFII